MTDDVHYGEVYMIDPAAQERARRRESAGSGSRFQKAWRHVLRAMSGGERRRG